MSWKIVVTSLLTVSLLGCGSPAGSNDGGGGGAGGGTGSAISSSGTIGGQAAGLRTGYVRLDSNGSALLILTSAQPYACPTSPQMFAPVAGEAGLYAQVIPADGGTLIGTFSFDTTYDPGTAGGAAFRGPTPCPAHTYVGGASLISGSITITAASGGLSGTLSGQLSGGEQVSAQFQVPACNIGGTISECL